jgi:2-oxoglutarate/2-oxoacid ferredoxin oxidoreductase subunit alpha
MRSALPATAATACSSPAPSSPTPPALGNDISTLPDFPAEIRAPPARSPGVSGYQIHFSSTEIFTPGDEVDTLVAMNPAALRTNLASRPRAGGIVIVNEDSFAPVDLKKAGYTVNPLEDGSLKGYRLLFAFPSTNSPPSHQGTGLSAKEIDRCKNLFALGLVYWLYERPLEPTLNHIAAKVRQKARRRGGQLPGAQGRLQLRRNHRTVSEQYHVPKAKLPRASTAKSPATRPWPGHDRRRANSPGKQLFYCSYPITPASDILHNLAKMKNFGVITIQAEDEIAAIGAGHRRQLRRRAGRDRNQRPGHRLKSEAMGLAVMTELPLVIIDVQRGGPSTGLPTKTEQADLLQAMFGRNGECPLPVIAAVLAVRLLPGRHRGLHHCHRYMTPVILLSDGYIANGAEPWLIPDVSEAARRSRQSSDLPRNRPNRSCPTNAMRDSSAPGRCPARPAWNTASAAWKNRTSPATSATTRPITSTWSACAPPKSPASPRRRTTFLWTGPETAIC